MDQQRLEKGPKTQCFPFIFSLVQYPAITIATDFIFCFQFGLQSKFETGSHYTTQPYTVGPVILLL